MKATQCYVSKSLSGLNFADKYGLTDYVDSLSPLVIFGMYRPEDLSVYLNHKSDVILVWQGCDAKDMDPFMVEALKSRQAKHYAISHWISGALTFHGIPHSMLPISATENKMSVVEPGDEIYFYYSDRSDSSAEYYGLELAQEVSKATGIDLIVACLDSMSKAQLMLAYAYSFINLRLTTWDGCPNTNLEIGLRGRPSVFNGMIPGSLAWNNFDDICAHVVSEYDNRALSRAQKISESIHQYLQIGDQWLIP